MSKGNAEFLKILDELKAMHFRKSADYGSDGDAFSNFRSAAEAGVEPWRGVMVRAFDKVSRIKAFMRSGSLKNESVEDSLLDLASYAMAALALRRESQTVGNQESVFKQFPHARKCSDCSRVGDALFMSENQDGKLVCDWCAGHRHVGSESVGDKSICVQCGHFQDLAERFKRCGFQQCQCEKTA